MNNLPFRPRMIFKVDDVKYKRYPVYGLYAASKDERIINIKEKIPRYGRMINTGYYKYTLRKSEQNSQSSV